MPDKVQQISVEEMFGIAKKFALQLKGFPMETESAIVEMIRVSMQHRNLQMQREQQESEMTLKAQHVKNQENMVELQRMAQQRESAQVVPIGAHAKAHAYASAGQEAAKAGVLEEETVEAAV
jgi:ribonuclease HI